MRLAIYKGSAIAHSPLSHFIPRNSLSLRLICHCNSHRPPSLLGPLPLTPPLLPPRSQLPRRRAAVTPCSPLRRTAKRSSSWRLGMGTRKSRRRSLRRAPTALQKTTCAAAASPAFPSAHTLMPVLGVGHLCPPSACIALVRNALRTQPLVVPISSCAARNGSLWAPTAAAGRPDGRGVRQHRRHPRDAARCDAGRSLQGAVAAPSPTDSTLLRHWLPPLSRALLPLPPSPHFTVSHAHTPRRLHGRACESLSQIGAALPIVGHASWIPHAAMRILQGLFGIRPLHIGPARGSAIRGRSREGAGLLR